MAPTEFNDLGNIDFTNKKYKAALAMYEKAIKLNTGEKLYYCNKARTLNELKRYKEALEAANIALQIDTNFQAAMDAKASALNYLGISELINKKYEAALEKFEEAIQLEPGKASFYTNKAKVLIKLEKYEDALKAAVSALQINADNDDAKNVKASALNAVGCFASVNKNHQLALQNFEEAIKFNPKEKLYYFNQASCLYELKRYKEQLKAADLALKIDANYEDAKNVKSSALNCLGDIEYFSNNYQAALQKYDEAIKFNSKKQVFYANKAWALNNLGRCEDALKAADRALKICANYRDARKAKAASLNSLGIIELNNKNYGAALEKFKEAIKANPRGEYLYLNKALALNELERHEGALKACDIALQINSNYESAKNVKASALYRLGGIDYRKKMYRAALDKFKKAIQLNNTEQVFYLNKARALFKLEQYKEAAEAADEALRLDAACVGAKNLKALVLNDLATIEHNNNNHMATLEKYEEAIYLNPRKKVFYKNKAIILIYLKNYQEAAEAADEALRLDPICVGAKNLKALALRHLGNIEYKDNNYWAALEKYEEAIYLNSGNKHFYTGKGASLIMLNRYQEAAEAADEALRLDATCVGAKNLKALALNNLGDQYYNNGKYPEALTQYTEAINQGVSQGLFHHNKAKVLYQQGLIQEDLGNKVKATNLYKLALIQEKTSQTLGLNDDLYPEEENNLYNELKNHISNIIYPEARKSEATELRNKLKECYPDGYKSANHNDLLQDNSLLSANDLEIIVTDYNLEIFQRVAESMPLKEYRAFKSLAQELKIPDKEFKILLSALDNHSINNTKKFAEDFIAKQIEEGKEVTFKTIMEEAHLNGYYNIGNEEEIKQVYDRYLNLSGLSSSLAFLEHERLGETMCFSSLNTPEMNLLGEAVVSINYESNS